MESYFSVLVHDDNMAVHVGGAYLSVINSAWLQYVPPIFTEILKLVIAFFKRVRVRMVQYLEDCLWMNQELWLGKEDRDTIFCVYMKVGFTINYGFRGDSGAAILGADERFSKIETLYSMSQVYGHQGSVYWYVEIIKLLQTGDWQKWWEVDIKKCKR